MREGVKRNFILQQGFEGPTRAICPWQYSALQFQPRTVLLWILAGILFQSAPLFAARSPAALPRHLVAPHLLMHPYQGRTREFRCRAAGGGGRIRRNAKWQSGGGSRSEIHQEHGHEPEKQRPDRAWHLTQSAGACHEDLLLLVVHVGPTGRIWTVLSLSIR